MLQKNVPIGVCAIHSVQIGNLGNSDFDVDRPNVDLLSSYCQGGPARLPSYVAYSSKGRALRARPPRHVDTGPMTPQQLEAAVITAINQVRAGQPVEDDRIELKREWPDPLKKARQLAGAVNKANGDDVVYIIGVDEKTGEIHSPVNTDVANWWPSMSARFDQVPPDLAHHINVVLGPNESVAVLHFSTSRAPYVVKSSTPGSSALETPIRDGTSTRSARRDELLRLLVPQASVPNLVALSASVQIDWHAAIGDQLESTSIWGEAYLFVEHIASSSILLPLHESAATLVAGDVRINMELFYMNSKEDAANRPSFGVHTRADGVVATGPGTFNARLSTKQFGDPQHDFSVIPEWTLELAFGVAGSSRRAVVSCGLLLNKNFNPLQGDMSKRYGRWVFAR